MWNGEENGSSKFSLTAVDATLNEVDEALNGDNETGNGGGDMAPDNEVTAVTQSAQSGEPQPGSSTGAQARY